LYDNKEKKYKGKFVIKKAKNKKGKEMRRECGERESWRGMGSIVTACRMNIVLFLPI